MMEVSFIKNRISNRKLSRKLKRKGNVIMCESIGNNGLVQLSLDEMTEISGGGLVSLFLSCVGLAVSPAVACLNPPAGASLALVSAGTFINNWPY